MAFRTTPIKPPNLWKRVNHTKAGKQHEYYMAGWRGKDGRSVTVHIGSTSMGFDAAKEKALSLKIANLGAEPNSFACMTESNTTTSVSADIESIKADRKSCIEEYSKDLARFPDDASVCGMSIARGFSCNRCGAMFETIISDAKFCPACQSPDLTPHGMKEHRFDEINFNLEIKAQALRDIEKQKVKINNMKEGKRKQNALNQLKRMEEDFEDEYVLCREKRNARELRSLLETLKLKAIYQPNKAAGEYAKLALNLHAGCSHGCRFCFNAHRFNGLCTDTLKKSSFENIESDLKKLAESGNQDRVHLTFIGDPYDTGRQDNTQVREVLQLFKKYGQPFQVLTKGGMLAARDFDLYKTGDSFGVTLTFDNPKDSLEWEHNAAIPEDRIAALKEAHLRHIETWVSMEPVINPSQTLQLIERTCDFVDFYWIGKLNHFSKIEKTIDWSKFRKDAEALLQKHGKKYGIKKALVDATAAVQ